MKRKKKRKQKPQKKKREKKERKKRKDIHSRRFFVANDDHLVCQRSFQRSPRKT